MDVTVGPEGSHDMGKIRGAYKRGYLRERRTAYLSNLNFDSEGRSGGAAARLSAARNFLLL
jgi:hypothetical protein